MLAKTHKIINVTATLGYALSHKYPITIPELILVAIGSTIPDIDNPSSWWGRTFPSIEKQLQHRGITHTIYPILILILLCQVTMNKYLISFTIGYTLHVIEDGFSKDGVNLFIPNAKGIHLPLSYTTGGKFESFIRKVAWIIFIYYVIEWVFTILNLYLHFY